VTLSRTHLIVIPTYNAGRLLYETVCQALAAWAPVWVVVDGSTDGSPDTLDQLACGDGRLTVIDRGHNGGKGAAVLDALRRADRMGFTHVLVMDSDGQHPPACIASLMALASARSHSMVLGRPVFGADAPTARIYFRRLSNFWVDVETLWSGVGDSLFGFRVYPVRPLLEVMAGTRWMRRFDFDPEAAVRLCWAGVRPVNVDVPVRYPPADQGGVSHFRYGRDNLLLTWMHLRLVCGLLRRLPALLRARLPSLTATGTSTGVVLRRPLE
jgi:glycosyltransferase involved in cell wall biosynthesis